jgi:rod shape-determining protein MreD
MIGTIVANILRFVLLVLLQVLVLDHIDLANGWAVPYLYVLFLLMLPLELPDWAGLLIGAFTGFVMDVFSSTPGMHMSACTVLMFARIHLLKLISPREGYEFGTRPNIPDMGVAWFLTYAGLLVVAHHLWLFLIELHSFRALGATFLRALVSAAFTLLLCVLAQLLTTNSAQLRK